MLAQQLGELVGPDSLRLVEIDEPEAAWLVVVDLDAAGPRCPDLIHTPGRYQVGNEAPDVPGVEEEEGQGLWP